MTGPDRAAGRRSRSRTLAMFAAAFFAVLIALWFTLTSGAPWVAERPAPTAEEVGAGRQAVLQLRASRTSPNGTSRVRLEPVHLGGMGALASDGFRPDRLALQLDGGAFRATGSHLLPGGRWLNVRVTAGGRSAGFPATRLTVGLLTLPESVSRLAFETARWLLTLRGADLPALDDMVRDVAIGPDVVAATIHLPRKSGLVDQLAGIETTPIDSGTVVRLYCRLAEAQRRDPLDEFAAHVRRTFSIGRGEARPDTHNRAAFVALAMLIVDERVGDLAGSAREDSRSCRIAPPAVTLHGRSDLSKHWALSAALAAGAGTRFARAMGEWKELADSLPDASGFSFVDLAADRSGFRVAEAAVSPGDAVRIAASLAAATPDRLLPPALLQRQEGLTNAEFVSRYGGIDDPRYGAAIRRIDRVLDREGIN